MSTDSPHDDAPGVPLTWAELPEDVRAKLREAAARPLPLPGDPAPCSPIIMARLACHVGELCDILEGKSGELPAEGADEPTVVTG